MTPRPQFVAVVLVCLGCGSQPEGQGPGHREQELALSPAEELELGRKAYREVLDESPALAHGSKEVKRVTQVGERIAETVKTEPLMREINLQVREYRFEWEFNVLEEKQVNAFCLPGGKVVVFTGLLHVTANDDQLAAVLGHEVAHALAHHASERLARQDREGGGLLAALREKKYDREQESEADHIGVFLMTFAGYDPRQAVAFWQHMKQLGDQQRRPPEILSDHPSDEKRIEQLQAWVPKAEAAKKAYDEGRVAPRVGADGLSTIHRSVSRGRLAMSIGGGGLLGSGGFFGSAGPSGPYGPYAGCGCSTLFIIIAGILLVCAVACACSTSNGRRRSTMRALCGAIIAAGALIGLGLAALGAGQRYGELSRADNTGNVLLREYDHPDNFSRGLPNKDHGVAWVKFSEMDRGLTVSITALILSLLAGLATAFIGLAFHHHRRTQELEHLRRQVTGTTTHSPVN